MPPHPPLDRLDAGLRELVRTRLEGFPRVAQHSPELRPAAVAIVLTDDARGAPAFLLTRRASHLPDHGGQWALPGGRIDSGEGPAEAALRELEEELGVVLAPDRVLGMLDDYPTRSGFAITPVVVWGGAGVALRPDPREVAAAYRVPLAELEQPEVPRFRRIPESDRPVVSIPLATVNTDLHAPTAAILYQLREVALRGRETRVSHLEAPVFAWR